MIALGLEYISVADPGVWKGKPIASMQPAHLNDLVSGRLFTEPGCTEPGS